MSEAALDVAKAAFADPEFVNLNSLPGGPCGAENPDVPGMVCEVPAAICFDFHQAVIYDLREGPQSTRWPNPRKPPAKTGNHPEAIKIRDRMKGGNGVPKDAERVWNQEKWVGQTKTALHAFLADRAEPFTTAEDFWPHIDAPREMRALSVVVQHAIKNGWMEEDSGVRLRGDYSSRDGVSFKINKIVPIYRSLIAGPRGATG